MSKMLSSQSSVYSTLTLCSLNLALQTYSKHKHHHKHPKRDDEESDVEDAKQSVVGVFCSDPLFAEFGALNLQQT